MQSEMSGITKLHKQHVLCDEENTALSSNSQRVPSPIFETDATIFTHADESNFGKKRKNKKQKNKIKRDEENAMIMSFSLHITLNLIFGASNSSSQTSRTQVPPRQSLRSIAPLACDGQCLPRP